MIANVTGKPYEHTETSQHLVDQLYNSVKWSESMTYLLQQDEIEFEELGVGDVLTKLTGYIKRDYAKTLDKSSAEAVKVEAKKKDVATSTTSKETKEPAKQEKSATQHLVESKANDTEKLVEHWNESHPIGTKVLSDFYENELETRSEAMILFGHRAAVYMKGYNGYFDLREVKLV